MNPFGFRKYVDVEIDRSYPGKHLNNSNNKDKQLLSSRRLVGESVSFFLMVVQLVQKQLVWLRLFLLSWPDNGQEAYSLLLVTGFEVVVVVVVVAAAAFFCCCCCCSRRRFCCRLC